jgi:hypothetical protein
VVTCPGQLRAPALSLFVTLYVVLELESQQWLYMLVYAAVHPTPVHWNMINGLQCSPLLLR